MLGVGRRLASMPTAVARGLGAVGVAGRVDDGAVRLGGRAVRTRARRVAEGEVLEVDVPEPDRADPCPPDPAVVVPIVHVDADVIVVDKPADLVVHPGAGHATGT